MSATAEEIVKLKGELDKHIETTVNRMVDGLKLEASEKEDIKNQIIKLKSIEEKSNANANKVTQLENALDEFIKANKRPGAGGAPEKSFRDEVSERLKEIQQKQEEGKLTNMGKHGIKMNFSEKAVGDFGAANLSNGGVTYTFAGPDERPGVKVEPLYDNHVRPYLPQTSTDRDSIIYVKEIAQEGGFGVTAMGALKPQWDLDLSKSTSNVTKIAGHFRIPEEMIDDVPYLLGYITRRGVEEYRNAEDLQLLYGDGTGINLAGLFTVATAFAAGTLKVATPNHFDVLVAAKLQLRKLNLRANVIWVSPEDWVAMRLAKGTDGHYIFPVIPGTNVITIDGTPIIENNRVATGQFLVADTQWCEIVDRKGVEVRMYEQDRDNAIKNMYTVVVEGRLAFPIYRNQAFVKGSFETATEAITIA